MRQTTAFLDPHRPLVAATADWLCAKMVRDPAGAASLAHMMVIVPTAQSGRNLRLALAQAAAARGWGGVLPPQIVQPIALIRPETNTYTVATTVQLRAALLTFLATRPRRHVAAERTVVDEWPTLFRGESLGDVRAHLAFFDQLADIWRILAGGGRLMREVAGDPQAAACLAAAVGNEAARWADLGAFETAFFAYLHALGLCHEAEAIHAAKTAAAALPSEIDEVVLPALADPVAVVYDVLRQQRDTLKVTVLLHATPDEADRFDAWGRPTVAGWTGARAPVLATLRADDVIRTGTDVELARRLAADFPSPAAGAEVPALGLCDEALYPELAAAFLNAGWELHNPERHALAASSLGQLLDALLTARAERADGISWTVWAALLRQDDVLSAVTAACPPGAHGQVMTRVQVLHGLDIVRNAFLPRRLPPDLAFDETRLKPFDRADFAAFCAASRVLLDWMAAAADAASASPVAFVRAMLRQLYARRSVGAGDKEFRQAALCVRTLLTELADPRLAPLGLSEGAQLALARQTLAEASYALEPESSSALMTEGWLELAWSPAAQIALAGFREGAVPDAVVGHAFLPDALRTALGLTSNEQRLARDTFLLASLLRARAGAPGRVRAYISQTNNAGDLHRPSRLLFCVASGDLAARVAHLFGALPPGPPSPPRVLMPGWRPRLPDAVEPYGKRADCPRGRYSASAIDTWLKCPFTYLFTCGLGMRRTEERTEIAADEFGTIIHRALELYAEEQLARTARGLAQFHTEADIADALARAMATVRRGYGAEPSVRVRLQLDAAAGRLAAFAPLQAQWAAEGWVIKEKPEYGFIAHPFAGEEGCDVPIKGSIDRIDWHPEKGYRIIDYKTWDSRTNAIGRILAGGAAHETQAARLKLPLVSVGSTPRRFLTVQLPLYGRCLQAFDPVRFGGQIADYCYVILGATAEETVVLGSTFAQDRFEAQKRGKVVLANYVEAALATARVALRRIAANIFWPPGPSELWRYDIKDVLMVSPEADFPLGTPWRAAQEAKLAALAAEGGAS